MAVDVDGPQFDGPADDESLSPGADVRKSYRDLYQIIRDREDDLAQTDNAELAAHVATANKLLQRSRKSPTGDANKKGLDAVLDSKVILQATKVGKAQAANLKKSTPQSLVEKIRIVFGHGGTKARDDGRSAAIDWAAVGREAFYCFRMVPSWEHSWDAAITAPAEKVRAGRGAHGPTHSHPV